MFQHRCNVFKFYYFCIEIILNRHGKQTFIKEQYKLYLWRTLC